MATFVGTHKHTLDDKGRISVPAQFRRQITGEDLYLTIGMDDCLELYPSEKWMKMQQQLLSMKNSKENRFLLRSYAQNLKAVSLDSQGRITIPSDLAKKVGISNEVVFLGKFETMELWQPAKYNSYFDDTEFSCEEVTENLELPL